MIPSRKPLIAVCAVRTGSGKSQTSRFIGKKLTEEEAEALVSHGKLTVQAKNCMNCHTLLGNGATSQARACPSRDKGYILFPRPTHEATHINAIFWEKGAIWLPAVEAGIDFVGDQFYRVGGEFLGIKKFSG